MQPNEKKIKLKPVIAIVCDDIREEDNGKPILIGIYTGGATLGGVVPPNPEEIHNWTISIWTLFEVEEEGQASFEIQIVGPDPKYIVKGIGNIVVTNKPPAGELVPFIIGPIPLRIWQDGEVKFMIKQEGESEFHTLRTIPVYFKVQETPIVSATSSSTVTAQLS